MKFDLSMTGFMVRYPEPVEIEKNAAQGLVLASSNRE
jgi:hypothetical protein